ncbi:MAG: hypothetical protein MZV70_19925 [Desulfobacterales bacterium]|nr:hypothetical protein [Desulfobacterales bacterium]
MTPITPRKNQYALRAVFELAKHRGQGPTKISDIADAQVDPGPLPGGHPQPAQGQRPDRRQARLLRRLLPDPLPGPDHGRRHHELHARARPKPRMCAACVAKAKCPHGHRCAFSAMWNRVNRAILQVYTETTIQDLLDNDRQLQGKKRSSRKRPLKTRQGRSL